VSLLQTLLLTGVFLADLLGAATVDHPLYFEQRSPMLFETRAAGNLVTIRPDRVELDGVTFRFVHTSKSARLEGVGPSAPSSYITRGHTINLRAYPKARVRRIYPGIDASFYGTAGHLEYDLDLTSRARAGRIRIDVNGARKLRLDEQGNLIVETRSGELRQLAPRVFQAGREVPAQYVLLAANEIGFRLGKHDPSMRLTIDPVIVYAKYFGGSNLDRGGPVATDPQGNVYVTGNTDSIDFPAVGNKARLQPPLLAYSNAGQTVTPLPVATQTLVTLIGGADNGKVLYVATSDGIFVSGNHGATWAQAMPLFPPGSGYINAISVDQVDPSRAWVATTAGLFAMNTAGEFAGLDVQGMAISGNGYVDVSSVEVSAANHAVVYATIDFPNYLYKTMDSGVTWQQLNPGYPGEPPAGLYSGNSIAFTLASNGSDVDDLYLIDDNSVLLKSSDAGSTWQQLAGQLYGAKSITLDPNNPSIIYVIDNLGLQRSTDGGKTFSTISPVQPAPNYIQSFAMDGTGALYILLAYQIEVSTDQGKTWKVLPPRPNPQVLVGLGGQVLAGVSSTMIPFVTKWSPDGSQMLYSTFFGGTYGDTITAISVDPQGDAIIAGNTASPDFPVTKTISPATSAAGSVSQAGFVAKLSADGSQAIYSSIIGASQNVYVSSLAVDSSGSSYITGNTTAPDFPTTANAFQTKLPSAMCQRPGMEPLSPSGNLNAFAFVSKLSADGSSLAFSTYLTGACGSEGQGIAIDSSGEPVVAGFTTSPDFPVSANAYQSTFPGGPALGVDYPDPIDFGFVSKLSAAGDKLIASSFIGGTSITQANAVALDSSGNTYITGLTTGITPGATAGVYQTQTNFACMIFNMGPAPPSFPLNAYLLKLDPALSSAQFLTYLGTGCYTSGNSILLAPSGNIWIAGTPAAGFPVVAPYELAGTGNAFVSEFNPDASQLLFSSYADGQYLALDPSGAIYVSGSGLPVFGPAKNVGFNSSVSLAKIDPSNAPPVIINSIGPSATYQKVNNPVNAYSTSFGPGELIEITGQNLGPSATVMAELDQTGRLPFIVNGTSVAFNDDVAPIISVQDELIVCFAPFEISGNTAVTVIVNGQKSTAVRVQVQNTAPYILSIVNQDGTANSSDHPAPQGSIVGIYVTGLGLTTPLSQDGSVSGPPLAVPAVPITAYVGQKQVQPQAVTAAPGLVAGITQVNLQIPKGDYSQTPIFASVNATQAQIYIGQ
jgi:uncharacterized protein (TIGR03437 family)